MNVRFPLSLKITTWLLLNLLLLGAAAVGFLASQGGVSWDSLVASPAGNRLQSLGNVIAGELAVAPEGGRDAVLARFGAAYGTEFYLFSMEGQQVAGEFAALGSELRQRVSQRPPWMGPTGPGPGPGPGAGQGQIPEPGRFRPEGGQPPAPGERTRGERREFFFRDFPRGRFLYHAEDPGGYWIGLTVPANGNARPGTMPGPFNRATLLVHTTSFWGLLRVLELQSLLYGATAVLLVSVLFWVPLVHGITRALKQLTRATEQIAEGKFDTRVPAARRDELGLLGDSVNRMAARLDTLVTGQKRFLGDVAHELCSPLARLQMATSILEERVPPGTQGAVADVREEVQQMNALVNELLAFTKAGLKPRDAILGEVEILPLVERMLAQENATGRVAVQVSAGLRVRADAPLLSRALANLVRNALRYAGETGPITLSARAEDAHVRISVEDEGPGVPAEALDRLGEPFYRPEAARTREGGGVGLGLAIVRSSVGACGGNVYFSNRQPRGFSAVIRLPAA